MPIKTMGLCLIALTFSACAPNSPSLEGQRSRVSDGARLELKDREGNLVGTLTVASHSSGGVRFSGQLKSFPPGAHGMHVHEVGKCEAPGFESAGGHFNPSGKQHGELNPQGAHEGDLGNIRIESDGTADVAVLAERVTLADGPNSLLKRDGTSLVIHANIDDLKTDPAGSAGDRIACGVITR